MWPQTCLGRVWYGDLTWSGGNFILRLPGNREDLLVRPTWEIIEYVAAIFLLLSTVTHTGVDQDGIHDAKENNKNDSMIIDINKFETLPCMEK